MLIDETTFWTIRSKKEDFRTHVARNNVQKYPIRLHTEGITNGAVPKVWILKRSRQYCRLDPYVISFPVDLWTFIPFLQFSLWSMLPWGRSIICCVMASGCQEPFGLAPTFRKSTFARVLKDAQGISSLRPTIGTEQNSKKFSTRHGENPPIEAGNVHMGMKSIISTSNDWWTNNYAKCKEIAELMLWCASRWEKPHPQFQCRLVSEL